MEYALLKVLKDWAKDTAGNLSIHYAENSAYKKALVEFAVACQNLMKFL